MGYEVCDHDHINALGKEIVQEAIKAGWVPEDGVDRRSFGDLIALLHSEASEALEEYRNGRGFTETYFNGTKPEGIPTELADVAIRLFFMAGIYGIDLETAIRQKIEFNKTRGGRYKNDGDHIVGADGKKL